MRSTGKVQIAALEALDDGHDTIDAITSWMGVQWSSVQRALTALRLRGEVEIAVPHRSGKHGYQARWRRVRR